MAANIFGRYVWLIEQFRRYGRLTYEEVNERWHRSGLSYGNGDDLPLRTFHNHRKAIADIFDVDIVCDVKGGYKYFIDHPEKLERDNLRVWLIDSYTMMNQIQADRKLEGRIIFEQVPSGYKWLHVIAEAMRTGTVLHITHRGFGQEKAYDFDIEPYYLKVVKRRWYVLARNPYFSDCNREMNNEDGGNREEDVYMVYALDRILDCRPTGESFQMNEDFDIDAYFRGCTGVIRFGDEPIRVVVKAYGMGADYLRSLPLHESQRELSGKQVKSLLSSKGAADSRQSQLDMNDNGAAYFELNVCPTLDFYQALLAQADQIEVVEPESVREGMKRYAKTILSYYDTTRTSR